ncbi:hypothetical protein GQ44DRAFT_817663 [Phaeosphaeriaceae sp. PMI808]|nr:hypothetical protein GQ44DRAFT_817663 [Phaeosphaeriaceae sp. PMI808]
MLAVLEPQTGLRAFESRPYWENTNDLRNILRHTNTLHTSRDPLLRVCYDMLEPKHENRIGAEVLLEKMTSLDPVFKCFCKDYAPKQEAENVDPALELSTKQQTSSQFLATLASSISTSRPVQLQGDDLTLEHLVLHPNRTTKPKRKKRGKRRNKMTIVEVGWGSRENFQGSYGLRMTPEDMQEGDAILEAMQRQDRIAETM